jgi:hypothetical protein
MRDYRLDIWIVDGDVDRPDAQVLFGAPDLHAACAVAQQHVDAIERAGCTVEDAHLFRVKRDELPELLLSDFYGHFVAGLSADHRFDLVVVAGGEIEDATREAFAQTINVGRVGPAAWAALRGGEAR